jgi:hypothetical protein
MDAVGATETLLHIKTHSDTPLRRLLNSEGKVVLVKAMKALRGRRGIVPLILNPALRGSEWSASRPDRFNPGGKKKLPCWDPTPV